MLYCFFCSISPAYLIRSHPYYQQSLSKQKSLCNLAKAENMGGYSENSFKILAAYDESAFPFYNI